MTTMNFYGLKQNNSLEDILNMSFEDYYQTGSSIGGQEIITPVIYLWNGGVISDIRVGEDFYTTYAYIENRFVEGETIGDCLARHRAKIEDVRRIIVTSFDTTGKEELVQVFTWTKEKGWEQLSGEIDS